MRDYQDPEFEAAFKKMNIQRDFDLFMARPMQSRPEELMEEFMVEEHVKKMSKRDKARKQFIQNFKRNQAIKKSLRNQVTVELEKLKDIEEGLTA